MQEVRRHPRSSDDLKRRLLDQLVSIRTEAKEIEVGTHILADIDKIEKDIQSARANSRKYRGFLKNEHDRVELVKQTLRAFKEGKREKLFNDIKNSSFLFLVVCIPYVFISKMYYLALIPKNIPMSSSFIYLGIGDILFWIWVGVCLVSFAVYRYLTIAYIDPFLERNPSLRIPTKFSAASTILLLYQQFLFHSTNLIHGVISPSWGPAVTNTLHLLAAFLTSNSVAALLALAGLMPIVGNILRLLVKRWVTLLPFHKSQEKPARC